MNLKKRFKLLLLNKIYSQPSKEDLLTLIGQLHPVGTNRNLIRIGGESDGGYLVPDDLNGLEACFSPGVGGKSKFERECADMGMEIFMADASVDGPAFEDPRFNFQKKFIGGRQKGNFMTLETWINGSEVREEADLLLQMDIEGFEYEVLNATSIQTLKRFRIIIIEFHLLDNLEMPWYYQRSKRAFEKLLVNHTCVHIHPNNSCGITKIKGVEVPGIAEFTFLRKDRIKEKRKIESLPHPLDRDSVAAESIDLPKIWYT
ncbi:FkbM family methyltransferase [Salinimicrobium sp. TIG7-5_MAKvit]|uniref:FkbM family methyltransferase n=1 Tax=Salinimicrobium sp. TIG7-5_MAKvit TaxID=3121289 RepID=UPI003C6E1634